MCEENKMPAIVSEFIEGDYLIDVEEQNEVREWIKNKLLQWQPVDPENLPVGEVLAKNSHNDVLTGRLHNNSVNIKLTDIWCCDGMNNMYNVTHYITIENLLKL